MVRAIMAGNKTQTRRVMKPQPVKSQSGAWIWPQGDQTVLAGSPNPPPYGPAVGVSSCLCPYGQPGDLLWCKEAWGSFPRSSVDHNKTWWGDEPPFWGGVPQSRPHIVDPRNGGRDVIWKADGETDPPTFGVPYWWSNARFMPRWASRLTMRITDVRVQRVQDMNFYDWKADFAPTNLDVDKALASFTGHDYQLAHSKALWNSINAKRGFGWDINPWVWALTFERIANGATP
jgi:hypothetical protein